MGRRAEFSVEKKENKSVCVCVCEGERGRKVTCKLSLESGGLSADSLTEGAPDRLGSPQEI